MRSTHFRLKGRGKNDSFMRNNKMRTAQKGGNRTEFVRIGLFFFTPHMHVCNQWRGGGITWSSSHQPPSCTQILYVAHANEKCTCSIACRSPLCGQSWQLLYSTECVLQGTVEAHWTPPPSEERYINANKFKAVRSWSRLSYGWAPRPRITSIRVIHCHPGGSRDFPGGGSDSLIFTRSPLGVFTLLWHHFVIQRHVMSARQICFRIWSCGAQDNLYFYPLWSLFPATTKSVEEQRKEGKRNTAPCAQGVRRRARPISDTRHTLKAGIRKTPEEY